MMARRESRVAARMAEGSVPAPARASTALPTLASTAGQRPSMALIQSGRGPPARGRAQAGPEAAAFTSSALSCREAKKARQEGSTELGSAAHRA